MNRLNKSVHFLGSIFLTFMCVITIPNTSFSQVVKCVKKKEFCSGNDCELKASFCNEYESNALKCTDRTKVHVAYQEAYEAWEEMGHWENVCGSRLVTKCKKESPRSDQRCEYQGYGDTGDCAGKCRYHCYPKHKVTKYRTAYRPEEICSQWDINVKFGNANIDPNLIEY